MKQTVFRLLKGLLPFYLFTFLPLTGSASTTLPIQGKVIPADNPNIQYVGRICFDNPKQPRFTFPGVQINARFTGTSLKMLELKPEFRGFVLDKDGELLDAPALPERRIEFIGNSITCGYGNESIEMTDPFEYETENHYYTYAQLTTRNLEAMAHVVARSGIGVYRSYDGPKKGTPENVMTTEYEYTNLYDRSERWDFSRYQPQVVCINLGTNDLSTNNYDVKLLKQAYKQFLKQVRSHNPQAKIVYLCGSMLNGKELDIAKKTLNEVVEEAHKDGDKEVYRFDFTPQNGDLYYGASWHPSLWQHQKMAGELTAYLRTLMHWF